MATPFGFIPDLDEDLGFQEEDLGFQEEPDFEGQRQANQAAQAQAAQAQAAQQQQAAQQDADPITW